MKVILSIAIVLIFSMSGTSQQIFIPNIDSIKVPASQLIKAAETIRAQQDTIAHLDTLVKSYEHNSVLQESIMLQQRQEIELLNHRVVISDGLIEKYQGYVVKESKKWYEHPVVHFAGGLMTAYVSSLIYNNIK